MGSFERRVGERAEEEMEDDIVAEQEQKAAEMWKGCSGKVGSR